MRGEHREATEVVLYAAELEPVTPTGPIRELTGRAVPYGVWTNRGLFMERVERGAFDKSIAEAAAGLPLLLFHNDEALPIGVATDWDSQPDGLHGVWRLDSSPTAQEAGRLAREGMLRYFSIGHTPIRSAWEMVDPGSWDPDKGPEHMDRVTRLEGRLLETSLVTTPAFATAQVKLVRSAEAFRQRQRTRPSLRSWQEWRASIDASRAAR